MGYRCDNRRSVESGQIFPLLGILILVMMLFLALGVDLGLAYVTKANLTKAVDAAALTGMRNISLGETQAAAIARNTFNANYEASGRDTVPPSVSIAFAKDANNNTVLNVNAAATIRTFFMAVLPQWSHLNVGANAQSTRAKLVMTLVLDRSGSMLKDGGSTALPPAATNFVNLFDDTNDRLAMTSFASTATTDVTMRMPFKTALDNAISALKFGGSTFGHGGLLLALAQENSVAVAPGENTQKVVIYFTDGWANTIQDTLACGGKPTLWNYGGADAGSIVYFLNPNSGVIGCSTSGGTPSCCAGVSSFTSAIDHSSQPFLRPNVSNDALWRAVDTANTMRNQGMTVYSIGLGNSINQPFLRQIANDPNSPTFNPELPEGLALFVPSCPSPSCSDDLNSVFQQIAAQILLRLTK